MLIIGNSREPYLPVKKDEKGFISFWDKVIALPVPDYPSRRLLWPALVKRHGGELTLDFDLSTLVHISDGYSSGMIDNAVRAMLTQRRLKVLPQQPVDVKEVTQWLSKAVPVAKEQDELLRKWGEKLPCNQGKKEAEQKPPVEDKKSAKKGKK